MPAETKSAPRPEMEKLEGAVFRFQNERERMEAIDEAFDYRGDVTLELLNGEVVEGYLFNRDTSLKPPRVEIFVKGVETPRIVPYADIISLAFTGKDTASGKSWHDWVNKKESDRKAEAERIKAEVERQGHL